jgi:hypothetical protein
VGDNRCVTVPPESTPSDDGRELPPADSDSTRELTDKLVKQPAGTPAGTSPWSREYAGPVPTSPAPPSWAAPAYPPPSAYAPPGPAADSKFPPAQQQGWPSASQQGWPSGPQQSRPSSGSRRGLWTGITLVSIAIVATLIAVLVSSTTSGSSSKSSASGGSTLPNPPPSLAPSPAPSQSSPANPQNPLPSLGTAPTPPGLLAIDYHAYALDSLTPSDVALGPAELVQFKKYGLSRVIGLQAVSLGPTAAVGDDWDADINILQFSSPAAAAAELNYSNTENKKDSTTIPLPGFPAATAFVNHDASTGISIGAFTTVGRYQVVVILSGVSGNAPTNAAAVAAEAAKVMKAVLPDAATIVPTPSSGGSTGPTVPAFPTPTPSGTHA